ncbi:SusD family protein [Mucilaginibacter pineti]|uniref:SusD family protein n=1 Tax=Mucilaginibacter pineti TaxID=1391627 RepID=A0A1G7L879_9SPHI|nr:RagB/SusD family nutrient uptake outer membrane protein [Mucilaginibacter pineti]SDF45727.1 SusD family protein [Mucilaginibacter pineti]
MKKLKIYVWYIILISMACFNSCKKDWLDAKPNKALVVPTSIADYQTLLDNVTQMNANAPGLGVVSDDNFRLTDATYLGISEQERNAYIWGPTENFYGSDGNGDWYYAYSRILDDNVVLDGIKSLTVNSGSQTAFNNVNGSALFYRSLDLYNLAQEFCKPYQNPSAGTDLGLPLRLYSNVNLSVKQSSVKQTYDQLIGDLLKAAPLLPVTPLYPTRPSKTAVYALLSRVYLAQENYTKALAYADSSLQLQNTLIDFNQLTKAASNPITRFNKEVIFHYTLSGYLAFRTNRLIVDNQLYQSFNSNDLRKSIYFTTVSGNISFKGSYNGNLSFFGGLATDEMYLNRAECYARTGNSLAAMNDLNALLKTRWQTGTYTNMTAANANAALSLILTERRKELCFRAIRWTDLRRLNHDSRFQVTISRTVNGQNYTLPVNSPRYVLPLDEKEIVTGGLIQNQR